jgi:hypothetical protein
MLPLTIGNHTNIQTKHITNLALLQKIFSDQELSILRGDTFLDFPVEVKMPNFTFFSHEISDKLAQDNKHKINMDKAIQALKRDEIILNTVSDAIITGDVQIDQIDFFISWPGILLIVFCILVLLLFVNTFYLLFKIRKLSIMLAVLQTAVLKVNAQTVQAPNLILNYFTTVSTNNTNLQIHRVVVETTTSIWMYAITTIVGISILSFVIYKVWNKTCKNVLLSSKFAIYLQFITAQNTIFVQVCELQGLLQDFMLTAESYITNIHITGHIIPKLNFSWPSLQIKDIVTGQIITLKETHNLNLLTAIQLKRIVSSPYICLPVFVCKNQIIRIHVQLINQTFNQQVVQV